MQPSIQDARKITLPKYGIKELKTKNVELAMLIHVCLQPKEIVLWHIKDKVIMLLENAALGKHIEAQSYVVWLENID